MFVYKAFLFLKHQNRNIQVNNSLITKQGQHDLFPFFFVGFFMILRCEQIQKHNRPSCFCYYEKFEKCGSKFWEDGLFWRRFPQISMHSWKLWRQYPERSSLDQISSCCLRFLMISITRGVSLWDRPCCQNMLNHENHNNCRKLTKI